MIPALRRRAVAVDSVELLILLVLPFILMGLTDSWTFLPPIGWIDPYLYTGFFLDLKNYLNDFGPTYYGSRLPWLLLGNAVYSIADTDAANLILRFALFYAATFSLYAIVRMLWRDRLAALATALLLGTNGYFLWAIGWDYPDGAGLTMTMVTLAFLTAATQTAHRELFLVLAGAAFATALSIQIFLVTLTPALLVWYTLTNLRTARHSLREAALSVAIGFLASVLIYGLINRELTGQFHYLEPQINAVRSNIGQGYKAANYRWLQRAGWLVFPGISLGLGLALVVGATRAYLRLPRLGQLPQAQTFAVAAALPMFILAAIFAYVQLFTDSAVLQISYYADYLVPFAFLVFGAAFALCFSRLQGRTRLLAGVLVTITLLAPFALSPLRFVSSCPECSFTATHGLLAVSTLVALAASLIVARAPLMLVSVFLLSVTNVAVADTRFINFSDATQNHRRFLMVYDANSVARRYNDDGQLRFWYDASEPLGQLYRGVSSMHLWGYRLISEDFPSRTSPTGETVPVFALRTIAVLSSKPDALVSASAALGDAGLQAELLGQATIERGGDAFDMYFIRTVPRGSPIEVELPLSRFSASAVGKISARGAETLVIETEAKRWSYAALLDLSQELRSKPATGPVVFRFRVKVDRGQVGIGVLANDGSRFIDQRQLGQKKQAIEVVLSAPRLADVSNIVVYTWDTNTAGRIQLERVSMTIYESGLPPPD